MLTRRRGAGGRSAFVVVVVAAVLALLVFGGWALLSGVPDDGSGTPQAGDPADGEAGPGGVAPENGAAVPLVARGAGDSSLPPPGTREGPAAKRPQNGGPWILVSPYERALADVDWKVVGDTYAKMIAVHNDMANAHARGDDYFDGYDTDFFSVLFEQEELVKERFGYVRPYHTMLHPAMLANSIAAALDSRKRGLTEGQLASLAELARRYSDLETKAQREDSGHDLYALDVFIRVGERRRKFMYDVHGLIDAKQRELLHSEHARDRRYLDTLGPAAIYIEPPKLVMYGMRKDAEEQFIGQMLTGTPPEARDDVIAIVRKHMATIPAETYEREGRIIDLMGYVKYDELIKGGLLTSRILHELDKELGAAFDVHPDAVSTPMVLVPFTRD